jgi:hypothetical protein
MLQLKARALRCYRERSELNWKISLKKSFIAGWKRIRIFSIILSRAASSIRSNLRTRCNPFPDMLELFETNPPVNVQESEYKRLLGYPKNHALAGRPRELADWARQWYAENGRPWFYARQLDTLELVNEKLRVAGTEFSSKQLHNQFAEAQADSAVLVAVSAGRECEEHARQLWQESKPDEYFFMEMFGSAVVEHLVTIASGRICGWADQNGMAALPHYSPGYSGWDISDQIKLWNLIRQNGAAHFDGKLDVMETGMLRPKKSQLTVFGVTRNLAKARSLARLIPCENCSLSNCQYRRAPYRRSPPQIEDVRLLQRGGRRIGGKL